MAYLPLAYIERFIDLMNTYCGSDRIDCEPEILLEMIANPHWGYAEYDGPKIDKYKKVFTEFEHNFFAMHVVSSCFAATGFIGVWKKHKKVYEPDYDFSKALMDTKHLRVYPHLIRTLPFDTFYMNFSKNKLFEYEGFFVQVKMYEDGTIRISSLPTEKNYSYIPVDDYEKQPTAYADAFWLKSEKYSLENGIDYFDYDLLRDYINTSDSYKTQWFVGALSNFRLFLLQFLMYLSSKEPDIRESADTINTYRPSNISKNKYSAIQKWEVGVRYGEKIRVYQEKQMRQQNNNEINRNLGTKRPHVRKAHWERYHTGKGRADIITKWKEPIFVNGNSEDIIATIHIVTDKEVKGSSGEEFVKGYLESKGISFSSQYYIREIRKLYDFSLVINGYLVFIEFDGEQHFKAINQWKGKIGYEERKKSDAKKNNYCVRNQIPLLRIRFD